MPCFGAVAQDLGSPGRPLFAEGVRKEQAGDLAGAAAAYEAALKADPSLIPALANLGMVELRAGKAATAAGRFREVLQRAPQLTQVEIFLALALFESGAVREAAAAVQAYERKSPNDQRVPHLMGLCLMQLDRLEEGAEQLEKALRIQPGNVTAGVSLATAYVAMGRLEEAERLLAAAPQGQDRAEWLLAKGMLLNARGKFQEAKSVLQKAAGMNPRLPGLHNQLGYTEMLLGDDAAAVAEFQKELALRPLDFQANANLGWILLRERKFSEADAALGRALKTKPDHPGALFLQGQLYFQTGEAEKARGNLELVVAARPEFRAAHVLLARTYGKLNRPEDVRRTQAVIARLTQEEQARNAGGSESYGGQNRTPLGEPATRGRLP